MKITVSLKYQMSRELLSLETFSWFKLTPGPFKLNLFDSFGNSEAFPIVLTLN